MSQLVTYCSTMARIQSAIESGAGHLILEHPDYSVKSLDLDYLDASLPNIPQLAAFARSLKPDIGLSLIWDQVIHHAHGHKLDALLSILSASEINCLRVHDLGLAGLMRERAPHIRLIGMHDTANLNVESVALYSRYTDGQVLSHQLCFSELQMILSNTHNIYSELLVHGHLALHYAPYPYSASFLQTSNGFLEDQDHPNRYFPIVNNAYGFFVMCDFERSLLNYLSELMQLSLDGWLLDLRGISDAAFRVSLQAYSHSSNIAIEQVQPEMPHHSFKPGFFRANRLDNRKFTRYETICQNQRIIGRIVDVIPKKWGIVELFYPISLNDSVRLVTPEDIEVSFQLTEIRDFSHHLLNMSEKHQFVKIPYIRKMVPKSVIIF